MWRNGRPAALHAAAVRHGPETLQHEPGVRAEHQGDRPGHHVRTGRTDGKARGASAHVQAGARLLIERGARDLSECGVFGYEEVTTGYSTTSWNLWLSAELP